MTPGYPLGESKHEHLMNISRTHGFASLDMEDSKLVLRAYTDRITLLSKTGLHPRACPCLALDLLRYAQRIICPGCVDLVPSVIRATFQLMWRDLIDGIESATVVIGSCAGLLECVMELLRFLLDQINSAGGVFIEALDAIIEEELINLVVRTLLVLCPTGAQLSVHKGR
ncbi:unnamed protein product [Rhizoctonia solani]|nr:unnamed protein product [Rhizoctonia solani]